MVQYIWRMTVSLALLELVLLIVCQYAWSTVSLRVSPKRRVNISCGVEGWSVRDDRAAVIADWRGKRPTIDVSTGSERDLDPETRALIAEMRETRALRMAMPWRAFAYLGIIVEFNFDGTLWCISISHGLLFVALVLLMTIVPWLRRRAASQRAMARGSSAAFGDSRS